MKFEKEVGIAIISKETSIAMYLATNLLAMNSIGSIGCCLFLFLQIQFQLGSYI